MSLKLIPVEETAGNGELGFSKKQKHFNPGTKTKKKIGNKESTLKSMCHRLVHYINRGGRYTFEQIDDLIVSMQHSILNLQKKKQEILRNKSRNLGGKKK